MKIAAAFLLMAPGISLAQVAVGAYYLPPPSGDPMAITAGPDGALWFVENAGRIGRITTAGTITEYPLTNGFSYGYGITTGPDGALWFTEYGSADYIGRITTAGAVTEYTVPTANSDPWGITAGPDGALWFTEASANKIGRITTSGAITEYDYPMVSCCGLLGITAGPDGALWFAGSNSIGRITTAGQFTAYPAPSGVFPGGGIVAGQDGALWFGAVGNIGRITTTGAFTVYPLPDSEFIANGITVGADGALWFTGQSGGIGSITTAGSVSMYPTGSSTAYGWIATGSDGQLWFTAFRQMGGAAEGQIAEAALETASLAVTPDSGYYKSSLTFAGSGFASGESVRIYAGGIGSAILATAMANTGGMITAVAPAPESPFGSRIFLGVGQTSGRLGAASFSIAPRLILTPNSGAVGSTVSAQGEGFAAFETIRIYWNNPRTDLGTVRADRHGSFKGGAAFHFVVPAGAPVGANEVFAYGETSKVAAPAPFTVQ